MRRISIPEDTLQKYIDNSTKWQRRALLLMIALSRAGQPEEASRIMKLSKAEATAELERWQNVAGVLPDEPGHCKSCGATCEPGSNICDACATDAKNFE